PLHRRLQAGPALRIVGASAGGNQMKRMSVLAVAGAPMGPAPAAKDPPRIANYWMDVATTSGMGAGMTPGGRPDLGQIMGMMSGGGGPGGPKPHLRPRAR